MKLIQEYLIKILILIIVSIIVIEGFIAFLLAKRARVIYFSVYSQAMSKTEEKSIEITRKIEEFATNLLTRYMADLKLMCKHALLLNGKKNYNEDEVINKDAEILKNSSYNIITATMEELNKSEEIKKYYSEETMSYDYMGYYEKEFKDLSKNSILNAFYSDKHKELNTIGYYNYTNNDSSLIGEEEQKSIKYIISILKTIYIKRYLIKKINMDYIRFFIIYKDEIYIYPPEAYNNTNIYFFQFSYPTGKCNFYSNDNDLQFPLCIYNYFHNNLTYKGVNNLIIIKEKIILQKSYAALCLKFPFLKNQKDDAFICSELEFSSIFNNADFQMAQKYEFGMFTFPKV
jgi:hypothetical protein